METKTTTLTLGYSMINLWYDVCAGERAKSGMWLSLNGVARVVLMVGSLREGRGLGVLIAMHYVAISKLYNVLFNHNNYSIIIVSSGIFRVRGKVKCIYLHVVMN